MAELRWRQAESSALALGLTFLRESIQTGRETETLSSAGPELVLAVDDDAGLAYRHPVLPGERWRRSHLRVTRSRTAVRGSAPHSCSIGQRQSVFHHAVSRGCQLAGCVESPGADGRISGDRAWDRRSFTARPSRSQHTAMMSRCLRPGLRTPLLGDGSGEAAKVSRKGTLLTFSRPTEPNKFSRTNSAERGVAGHSEDRGWHWGGTTDTVIDERYRAAHTRRVA